MDQKRFKGEPIDPVPLGKALEFSFIVPTKELVNVYRRWGEGDFGTIATGNIMVEYDNLEAAGNPIIPREAPFSGDRFDGFREVALASKAHGSLVLSPCPAIQRLYHLIERIRGSHQTSRIIPSVQAMYTSKARTWAQLPASPAMTQHDINLVVDGFAHDAEYCYRAGYGGGTNKRTDKYCGSITNCAGIIFEISNEICARVRDESFVVGIKINSVEFQSGGFTHDECKLEFADMIVPELTRTKVIVTGGQRTINGMVKALDTVHIAGLTRPISHEFDVPNKILSKVRLVGSDSAPVDFTIPSALEVFNQAMQSWIEEKAQDASGTSFG
ncbi:hypothetical protein F5Y19DRAFT_468622 [Xylariaceae sp. FL1651]|nr:hypothetical protein F5Y19DRAFT_468622 [Xylariaceae sp. FL1651]